MFKKTQISSPLARVGVALGGLLVAATVYAQPMGYGPCAQGTPMQGDGATYAPCHGPGPGPMRGHHWGGGHRGGYWNYQAIESLNLTDAQKEQLSGIAQASFTDAQALRTQLHETRVQLNLELIKPQLDKAAIAKLQAQQADLTQKLSARTLEARIQAAEVLTVEQRTTLNQQVEAWRQQWSAGPNAPRGPGAGPNPQANYNWLLVPMPMR